MQALGTERVLGQTETNGAFGLVIHDLPAKTLGAPFHTHKNEDEFSYVMSGTLTAQIGDEIVEAGPGEAVVKPRGIRHAFWNAGDEEVRFVEIISPSGLENYFFELAGPINAGDFTAMDTVRERYDLEMEMETMGELIERHGLNPVELPAAT